jgi:hypothetical protein
VSTKKHEDTSFRGVKGTVRRTDESPVEPWSGPSTSTFARKTRSVKPTPTSANTDCVSP